MTIKIAMIDDQPDYRLVEHDLTTEERIKAALDTLGAQFTLVGQQDNSKGKIETFFQAERPDLVILDWNFPQGRPTGAETLGCIRKECGFAGPILILTTTFASFEEHLGPEGADHHYWRGLGTQGLCDILARMLTRLEQGRQTLSITGDVASVVNSWPHYPDFGQIIARHGYHPQAGKKLSEEEQVRSCTIAALLTTAYDGTKSEMQLDTARPMGKVIETIEGFAATDIPILVLGETGTGKELIARLLHFQHKRAMKYVDLASDPGRHYLAVNCGAFAENLLDSELFGCFKWAYTGASDKAGLFEQVSYDGNKLIMGGTVFLDELALMPLKSQAFLLRVLQEREVLRMGYDLTKYQKGSAKSVKVGDTSYPARLFGPIPVNFRLVTATNENLLAKAKKGDFRLDLYYRIAQYKVRLPNLRDRGAEDFNLLFQYFLQRFNKKEGYAINLEHKGGSVTGASRDLLVYLWTNFPWKGNIRELESFVNVMATLKRIRSGSTSTGSQLTIQDIPDWDEDF
jgi:transcriptional regulator with PAS, ATPase and Fis domain/CheY-like chemotaxis protein